MAEGNKKPPPKKESSEKKSKKKHLSSIVFNANLAKELEAFLSLSDTYKRNMLLNPDNPKNATFPWLTTEHINKEDGESKVKYKYEYGRLHKSSDRYKFMDVFKDTKFGKIFFAIMRKNDLWCNIKVYYVDYGEETSYNAHREAEVLKIAAGSNLIVRPIEFFKTLVGLHIVTEHFGNITLHNFIKSKVRFNDLELKFFATELVSAVSYLHEKGIIHRCLTANNVGITGAGHIKLFDIGGAYLAQMPDGTPMENPELTESIGDDAIAYKAPEIVNLTTYGYSVDWWNVGTILYFMMYGELPFHGATIREILNNILRTPIYFDPMFHSELTLKFVQGLLEKDPKMRLGYTTSREVSAHRYFQNVDWEVVANLGYDPPLPTKSHVATNLPASLCRSIDSLTKQSLDTNVDITDNVASRRIKTLQSINPYAFSDIGLYEDWTNYMDPYSDLHRGFVYVEKKLFPPDALEEDDMTGLQDCIVTFPDLSGKELKDLEYSDDLQMDDEKMKPLYKVRAGENMFRMVSKSELDDNSLCSESTKSTGNKFESTVSRLKWSLPE